MSMTNIDTVNNILYNMSDLEQRHLEDRPDLELLLMEKFPNMVALDDYDEFINREMDVKAYEWEVDEQDHAFRNSVCDLYTVSDYQIAGLDLIFEAR